MQFTEQPWHASQAPWQDKANGEIGGFLSALIVLCFVVLLVVPVAYFMSQAGLLEKTIAISTLVAVLAMHVIKTVGR